MANISTLCKLVGFSLSGSHIRHSLYKCYDYFTTDNLSVSTESLDEDSENVNPMVNDCFQSLPSRSPHENLNPHNLKVRSTVYYGDPPKFGVIKWIGMIPPRHNMLYAGLEMVSINICGKCYIHNDDMHT